MSCNVSSQAGVNDRLTVLALDTSSVASVSLRVPGKPLLESEGVGGHSHNEELSVLVGSLLKHADLKREDIGAVVIGAGPGSFTGLRIGFGFLAGFSYGRNFKVAKVSSLEAFALEHLEGQSLVFSIADARRGEVFIQAVRKCAAGLVKSVSGATQIVPVSELMEWCRVVSEKEACKKPDMVFSGYPPKDFPYEVTVPAHTARSLTQIADVRGFMELSEVVSEMEPDYVRAVAASTIAERLKSKQARKDLKDLVGKA